MILAQDKAIEDLTPDGLNISGRVVKNMRICGSGLYPYALTELDSLGITKDSIPPEYAGKFIFNVYRPAEVLEQNKHLFARQPITINHPTEYVTKDNIRKYFHGLTGDSVDSEMGKDGELYLYTTGTLCTDEAIKFYDRNKELSMGYTPHCKWLAGEYKGKKYELTMVGLKDANHAAIVPNARGGHQIGFLDSGNLFTEILSAKEKPMAFMSNLFKPKVEIDGATRIASINALLDSFPLAKDAADQKVITDGVKGMIYALPASDSKKQLEEYLGDLALASEGKFDDAVIVKAVGVVKELAVKVVGDSADKVKEPKKDETPATVTVPTVDASITLETAKVLAANATLSAELAALKAEVETLKKPAVDAKPAGDIAPGATGTSGAKCDDALDDSAVLDGLSELLAKRKKKDDKPTGDAKPETQAAPASDGKPNATIAVTAPVTKDAEVSSASIMKMLKGGK